MNKFFFCFLFSCIFEVTIFGQYITLEGKQFKDENGQLLYPLVCNYCISLPYKDSSGIYNFGISPDHHYGGSPLMEWGPSLEGALDRIFVDFNEIKNMGFNTIRLMSILTKNNDTTQPIPNTGYANGFYKWDIQYKNSWDDPTIYHQFLFTRPYNTCQDLKTLLYFYRQVIQKAADAGLCVILVPAGGKDLFQNQIEVNDYRDLLLEFCDSLKNEGNLLAYDLFNEPCRTEFYDHKKGEICDWVAQLYDAIHTIDPNHLITVGGSIVSILDIRAWDPSVLKIDFWSPHFYPPYNSRLPITFNSAIEKVTNDIVWLRNNCPIPWIIGETGFVAEDDDLLSNVWGTENEMSNYAQQTLNTIRDAGGSGYSWWQFQHVFYYTTPPLPCPPYQHHEFGTDDYYNDISRYYSNNFGLLGSGEPNEFPAVEKPVVDVFQAYLDPVTHQPPDPGSPPVPNNYGATGNNPNHPNKITCTVLDQNGVPIKDAVIWGWNFLKTLRLDDPDSEDPDEFNSKPTWNEQYTFTNNEGQFTLIPYDYILPDIEHPHPVNNLEYFEELRISCLGCEDYFVNWPSNNPDIPMHPKNPFEFNGTTFYLNRATPEPEYEKVISNKIIDYAPPPANFSAWNKLTLNNVIIVGNGNQGGISDMTARTEIHANPDFYAQRGSEVHLFLSEVFRECSSLSPFKNIEYVVSPPENQNQEFEKKEIEMSFLKDGSRLSVYPNPTSGQLTLEILYDKSSTYKVVISDMFGSCIKQFISKKLSHIDLKDYPKGVYTITTYSENELLESCKIILY